MSALTKAERDTLNAAMAIIQAHTPVTASWLLHASNYTGKPGCGVTFFDTNKEQHSEHSGKGIQGDTFGDKINAALAIQQSVEDDREGYLERRRVALRKELASLEAGA